MYVYIYADTYIHTYIQARPHCDEDDEACCFFSEFPYIPSLDDSSALLRQSHHMGSMTTMSLSSSTTLRRTQRVHVRLCTKSQALPTPSSLLEPEGAHGRPTVSVVGISNWSLDPASSPRRASAQCQAAATPTFGGTIMRTQRRSSNKRHQQGDQTSFLKQDCRGRLVANVNWATAGDC